MIVRGLVVLAAALVVGGGWSDAFAQPQVPATFFGSVSVDGKPPPDGTEVRGFIDGQDCTQLGPTYRGTVTDGGVGQYVINVVHESQKAGCGKEGKAITFTIGGRGAVQTATWKLGPQRLDLSAGQGTPPPLPTATATRTLGPTQAAATATEAAQFTPKPAGTLPTDDVQIQLTPMPGNARSTPEPGDNDGGFPVLLAVLIVVAVLAAGGAAGGVVLSRRGAGGEGGGPGGDDGA